MQLFTQLALFRTLQFTLTTPPLTQNLHFAYIGGQLVTEMLRDAVIQDFEKQYIKACDEEHYEQKLSAAIDRYESKKDLA